MNKSSSKEIVQFLLKNDAQDIPEIREELNRAAKSLDPNQAIEVMTVVPLTEGEKQTITKKLTALFDRDFERVTNTIDKTLIGGMKIQLGDYVIDASVKGSINHLKQTLLS